MVQKIKSKKLNSFFRATALCVLISFTQTSVAPMGLTSVYAQQSLLGLPAPGASVPLTPSFEPITLIGLKVYPENPFQVDFVVDSGDSALSDDNFESESEKLIKYFLSALTIPEKDLWVNLSPHEENRIISSNFGQTEMGRDLLAQDYILKQITASLIYPENDLGKQFWNRVYSQAYEKYGTTDIPIDTFNKVWIVPKKAVIYENENKVFVADSELEVMLEQDYLALENVNNKDINSQENSSLASNIVRDIVIPQLQKEVNQGVNFAQLRQIYNAVILAAWFKENLRNFVLTRNYADQSKILGVDVKDKQISEKIYQRYLDAFKKGVCNFVKVEYSEHDQKNIPRRYFSGGTDLAVSSSGILEKTKQSSSVIPKGNCAVIKQKFIVSSQLNTRNARSSDEPFSSLLKENFDDNLPILKNILRNINMNFAESEKDLLNLSKFVSVREVTDELIKMLDKHGGVKKEIDLRDFGFETSVGSVKLQENGVISIVHPLFSDSAINIQSYPIVIFAKNVADSVYEQTRIRLWINFFRERERHSGIAIQDGLFAQTIRFWIEGAGILGKKRLEVVDDRIKEYRTSAFEFHAKCVAAQEAFLGIKASRSSLANGSRDIDFEYDDASVVDAALEVSPSDMDKFSHNQLLEKFVYLSKMLRGKNIEQMDFSTSRNGEPMWMDFRTEEAAEKNLEWFKVFLAQVLEKEGHNEKISPYKSYFFLKGQSGNNLNGKTFFTPRKIPLTIDKKLLKNFVRKYKEKYSSQNEDKDLTDIDEDALKMFYVLSLWVDRTIEVFEKEKVVVRRDRFVVDKEKFLSGSAYSKDFSSFVSENSEKNIFINLDGTIAIFDNRGGKKSYLFQPNADEIFDELKTLKDSGFNIILWSSNREWFIRHNFVRQPDNEKWVDLFDLIITQENYKSPTDEELAEAYSEEEFSDAQKLYENFNSLKDVSMFGPLSRIILSSQPMYFEQGTPIESRIEGQTFVTGYTRAGVSGMANKILDEVSKEEKKINKKRQGEEEIKFNEHRKKELSSFSPGYSQEINASLEIISLIFKHFDKDNALFDKFLNMFDLSGPEDEDYRWAMNFFIKSMALHIKNFSIRSEITLDEYIEMFRDAIKKGLKDISRDQKEETKAILELVKDMLSGKVIADKMKPAETRGRNYGASDVGYFFGSEHWTEDAKVFWKKTISQRWEKFEETSDPKELFLQSSHLVGHKGKLAYSEAFIINEALRKIYSEKNLRGEYKSFEEWKAKWNIRIHCFETNLTDLQDAYWGVPITQKEYLKTPNKTLFQYVKDENLYYPKEEYREWIQFLHLDPNNLEQMRLFDALEDDARSFIYVLHNSSDSIHAGKMINAMISQKEGSSLKRFLVGNTFFYIGKNSGNEVFSLEIGDGSKTLFKSAKTLKGQLIQNLNDNGGKLSNVPKYWALMALFFLGTEEDLALVEKINKSVEPALKNRMTNEVDLDAIKGIRLISYYIAASLKGESLENANLDLIPSDLRKADVVVLRKSFPSFEKGDRFDGVDLPLLLLSGHISFGVADMIIQNEPNVAMSKHAYETYKALYKLIHDKAIEDKIIDIAPFPAEGYLEAQKKLSNSFSKLIKMIASIDAESINGTFISDLIVQFFDKVSLSADVMSMKQKYLIKQVQDYRKEYFDKHKEFPIVYIVKNDDYEHSDIVIERNDSEETIVKKILGESSLPVFGLNGLLAQNFVFQEIETSDLNLDNVKEKLTPALAFEILNTLPFQGERTARGIELLNSIAEQINTDEKFKNLIKEIGIYRSLFHEGLRSGIQKWIVDNDYASKDDLELVFGPINFRNDQHPYFDSKNIEVHDVLSDEAISKNVLLDYEFLSAEKRIVYQRTNKGLVRFEFSSDSLVAKYALDKTAKIRKWKEEAVELSIVARRIKEAIVNTEPGSQLDNLKRQRENLNNILKELIEVRNNSYAALTQEINNRALSLNKEFGDELKNSKVSTKINFYIMQSQIENNPETKDYLRAMVDGVLNAYPLVQISIVSIGSVEPLRLKADERITQIVVDSEKEIEELLKNEQDVHVGVNYKDFHMIANSERDIITYLPQHVHEIEGPSVWYHQMKAWTDMASPFGTVPFDSMLFGNKQKRDMMTQAELASARQTWDAQNLTKEQRDAVQKLSQYGEKWYSDISIKSFAEFYDPQHFLAEMDNLIFALKEGYIQDLFVQKFKKKNKIRNGNQIIIHLQAKDTDIIKELVDKGFSVIDQKGIIHNKGQEYPVTVILQDFIKPAAIKILMSKLCGTCLKRKNKKLKTTENEEGEFFVDFPICIKASNWLNSIAGRNLAIFDNSKLDGMENVILATLKKQFMVQYADQNKVELAEKKAVVALEDCLMGGKSAGEEDAKEFGDEFAFSKYYDLESQTVQKNFYTSVMLFFDLNDDILAEIDERIHDDELIAEDPKEETLQNKSSSNIGGISLKSSAEVLQRHGQASNFDTLNQSVDIHWANIPGLTPVILSIVPISDFHGFVLSVR